MKKVLSTMMLGTALLVGSTAVAQTKYHITLQGDSIEKTFKQQPLYLFIDSQPTPVDSAKYINHQYVFKGKVKEVVPGFITSSLRQGNAVASIIIDQHPVSITLNHPLGIKEGSEENKRYIALQNTINQKVSVLTDIRKKVAVLSKNNTVHIPDSVMTQIEKEWKGTIQQIGETVQKGMEENKENMIPAALILNYADLMDNNMLSGFLKTYKYRDLKELQPIIQMIEADSRKAKGVMFTDLSMKNLDGKEVKVSDIAGKGKYVLLDFWASWCGPCRAEIPHIKELYNKYHPLGFEIIGISFDNNETAWKNGVKRLDLPWVQMSDLKGWKSEAAKVYNIRSIPFTILLDPEGKIVDTNLRHEALKEVLNAIYKQ